MGDNVPLQPHGLRGRQLRRTLFIVTIAWFFGSVWLNATSGTPQANFAKALGASNFQYGLLSALPYLACLLSLPGTLMIEATGNRKGIFLAGLYFQRLLWIPIALVPTWIYFHYGSSAAPVATSSFLSLIFLMYAGNAVGGPAWQGWMADIVPPGVRGRYFSQRRQWGLVSAIPAAWLSGWVLDHYTRGTDIQTTLNWCAVVFLIACPFGVLDIFFFHWVPTVPTPPKKGTKLFRSWGEPLRNHNYLWFAGFVGTMFFAVSFMGWFVTVFIMRELGAGEKQGQSAGLNQITQLMLIAVPALAQLSVARVWGRAADRMGKRPILVLAALGFVPVALGWCFVTRDRIWLGYVLSALGGMLWAGVDTVNQNMVLEFSGTAAKAGTKGGTAYAGVNSVITSIAGGMGGLSAGVLAEWLRNLHWQVPLIGDFTFFHALFVLSGVLRLLAVVVFLPFVHEPGARPAVETLRYMSANIYNNLFSAATLPLRVMGAGDRETKGEETEER